MDVLGIIFAYSDRENLRELTEKRTIGSVPLAGKYRIIDFVLSNFVNSGIHDVSVVARSCYHSLMDHLGAGEEWDLNRKRGGLRLLTPYGRTDNSAQGLYRGTVEALAANMHSFRRSMAEYVIISGTSILYSMDMNALLRSHIERNADITVVYTQQLNGHPTVPLGVAVYQMDERERLQDLSINTDDIKPQKVPWSTGVFVMRKSLLEALVADAMAYGRFDFYTDILQRLAPNLNILGYEYKGYLLEITSVAGYMQANMNFLKPDFRQQVFAEPVYTKVKDSVPTQYVAGCQVQNSMIADGCWIEGTVENSIISRSVKIGKGAVVRNSVVLQGTEIMPYVGLNHVILDKDVIVREHGQLSGHETYPVVVAKGNII